jgi:hypothetical protein
MRAVVRAAVPLRKPAPVFAARSCLCGGLALCSGAVTVTPGRGELGVVCEAAVPLRPHNSDVDRIAIAEGATRPDDILITRSPQSGIERRPDADTVSRSRPAVLFDRNHAPAQSPASSTLAATHSVEPSIRRSAATSLSPKGRPASLEMSDVSRGFPRGPFLKFSMSGRQGDTLRYKMGCHLPRRLVTLAYEQSGPHSRRRR